MQKRIQYQIEYYLFIGFLRLFQFLPQSITLSVLKGFCYLIGYVFGMRKSVVRHQLCLCLPDNSPDQIDQIIKRIYRELAVTVAEVFIFSDDYFKDKVEIIGYDEVRKNLSYGRGLIIVSAHFGNWELAAKLLAKDIPPVYGIVKKQHNELFNEYLDRTRRDAGIITVEMKNAFKQLVSALQKNSIVAVLIDQYAFKNGVAIDFLGNKTKAYTSIAQLSLKYQIPVITAFDIRDSSGHHQIIYNKAMVFRDLEYNEENILQVTKAINVPIEENILQYPQLWFWVHKKFR